MTIVHTGVGDCAEAFYLSLSHTHAGVYSFHKDLWAIEILPFPRTLGLLCALLHRRQPHLLYPYITKISKQKRWPEANSKRP